MANAQVLQNAANRFASVAGFPPLAVDGVVGARTLEAVQRALSYISISSDDGGIANNAIPDAISNQAAAFAANAARSASVLAANAAQVGAFLNYVADMLHLAPIYGPPIVPQTNAAVAAATGLTPLAPRAGAAASILDAFKRLATWQKVSIAAAGVFGVIAVAHKVRERKQLQGFRY